MIRRLLPLCLILSCADSAGEYGATTRFVVPATPTGIAPSGATSNNPEFRWTAVSGGDQYELWVDDSTASPVIDQTFTAAAVNCPAQTGQCFITTGVTIAPGVGQFWVRGIDNVDGPGPWSAGVLFSVNQNIQVTLVSPSGTITTRTPTYVWNANPGVTAYRLWVDDTTAQPVIDQTFTPAAANCATGAGQCSVTPPTMLAFGNATFWVQANQGGLWSSPLNFLVQACVTCDDGRPCTDDVCDPVLGCIFTDDDTNVCDDTNGCTTGDQCTEGTCRASDQLMCAATSIGPSGPDIGYNPTYQWAPVPGVSTYRLWIDDDAQGTFTFAQSYTEAEAGCVGGVGTCSVTPAFVLPNGPGQWWVQTPPLQDGDAGGLAGGPWSVVQNFSLGITQVPTTITPDGMLGTNNPTYVWNPIAGMNHSYQIWVDDSTTSPRVLVTVSEAVAGCPNGAGTCSYDAGVALAPGFGQWWVRANASGPWSATRSFTVP